ncbi:MAG: lanthionine synthetase LanC family protein [Mycobacterium sp.]
MLFRHATGFKIPESGAEVATINAGNAGSTQVGKIVTIYCNDDQELRAVRDGIASVWADNSGPTVPSDLADERCPGMYYRYGAFTAGDELDPCGRFIPTITDPSGKRVPDNRSTDGSQAEWAPVPPVPVRPPPAVSDYDEIVIAGRRYLPVARYVTKPGLSVCLAIDVETVDPVIVKRANPGALSYGDGVDTATRLRREFEVLTRMVRRGLAWPPAPLGFEGGPNTVALVEQFRSGTVLKAIPMPARLAALPVLARQIDGLHAAGYVHRDIKPENILVDQDGVALIDFDISAPINSTLNTPSGTPRYIPPEGNSLARPAVDLFGLGVTLFRCLSPGDVQQIPSANFRGRMLGELRMTQRHQTVELVAALTCDPEQRISAAEAGLRLDRLAADVTDSGPPSRRPLSARQLNKVRRDSAQAADTVAQAQVAVDGEHHAWEGFQPDLPRFAESLAYGAAGAIIGLATIDETLGTERFSAPARNAARWLASHRIDPNAHGLFTGNAGIAVALALAGVREGDSALIAAAENRLRAASRGVERDHFDLFSGSAGVLWAGCALAAVLGDQWPIHLVEPLGQRLLSAADARGGVVCWPSSPHYEPTRHPFYGAAHGSTGIALALITWSQALSSVGGQVSCEQAAARTLAARTFESVCRSGLGEDRASLRPSPDAAPAAQTGWCHGTAGLVWALVQAVDVCPELADLLDSLVARWNPRPSATLGPTLCHGLSGLIDALRAVIARGAGNALLEARLTESLRMLRLLTIRGQGALRWAVPADEDMHSTADLLDGNVLGPAVALAMMAAARRPPLISTEWLATLCGCSRTLATAIPEVAAQ